ncbi:hypothetical protein GGX14DRAFT_633332 [Mycena pura]|uniref:Uncharacterized protein n=1 Tax=Mycena pura TaxID=153505 RepID=A0AAD6VFR3_9AGAR|nr:hypothetical protein GGX14DRAFT_633332 [Mycena pura]
MSRRSKTLGLGHRANPNHERPRLNGKEIKDPWHDLDLDRRLPPSLHAFRPHDVAPLRYTRPFFTGQHAFECFFHALEDFRSWIIGSVPLAALLLSADPPDNLNIIANLKNDQLQPWYARTSSRRVVFKKRRSAWLNEPRDLFPFMVDVLRFNLEENAACSGVYEKACFISATEIGTPYVEMTSRHEGAFSWVHRAWQNSVPSFLSATGRRSLLLSRGSSSYTHPRMIGVVLVDWRVRESGASRVGSKDLDTGSGEGWTIWIGTRTQS